MKEVIKSEEDDVIKTSEILNAGIYAYLNKGGSPILLVRPELSFRFCSLARPLLGPNVDMRTSETRGWYNSAKTAIEAALEAGYTVYKFKDLIELCDWIFRKA